MPSSPTRLFVCDQCGATLPVEPEHAGKKCRCGKCGKVMLVPGDAPDEPAEPTPQYVAFNCILCDTRLSARVEDVGLKAKCPDCGKLTKVPPPPKPRPKRIPKSMHGQQYGLWGVDEAPLPKEIASRQPKFFPVWCQICDTLMHARAEQVGKHLTCPDCGGKTLFKELPREQTAQPALVADGEEYQLDESEPLPQRPVYVPQEVLNRTELEARELAEHLEYTKRDPMPAIPLVKGVSKMLLRRPVPEAVFGLAFALALELWFIANARANVSGMALALVMASYATTAVWGVVTLLAASAFWLAVLKESSEGNDRLFQPPGPVFLDWAGESFYVVFASSMSVAPGLLFWRFVPDVPEWAGPVATAGCWLLLFPIFLLSQLENGSPLEFFSPKLVCTLLKRPGQWLLFYSEALLATGGCAAAVVGLQILSAWMLAASVLIVAGTSFLYFRLLGRLAWWLAESLAVEDETNER